jgi:hypothetical protein
VCYVRLRDEKHEGGPVGEVSAATAALAYCAFATAMTIGRFLANAVAARDCPESLRNYSAPPS